jgi:hypothetical protein
MSTPQQPSLVEVGTLAPEVMAGIQGMRQRTAELLQEMGRIELRKLNIAHEIQRLENQSQVLLRQEAEKLGIAEGTPWQLTPEGKALAPPAEPQEG